jgi:hypothetical protein
LIAVTCTTPPLRKLAPVYVFTAVSTKRPGPALVNVDAPVPFVMMEEIVNVPLPYWLTIKSELVAERLARVPPEIV